MNWRSRRRIKPVQVDRAEQVVVDKPISSDVYRRLFPARVAQTPTLVDVPVVGSCQSGELVVSLSFLVSNLEVLKAELFSSSFSFSWTGFV